MTKIITIFLVAILAVSSIYGVYAATSINPTKSSTTSTDELYKDSYHQDASSEIYEVVDFKAPDKIVYSLDEIYDFPIQGPDGDTGDFIQQICFDGEGTSMTVKNKETDKTETIEYDWCYISVGDEKIKTDKNIYFEFTPEINEVLVPGEYTAVAGAITSDDEYVEQMFTFTLE